MVTNRSVWRLAAPMILSNITVPLLGAVDTAVVGHLDDAVYLGAVSVGALLFTYIYWAFGFLRMGTTGLVAQAVGRKDADGVRAVLARAGASAVAIGLALIALQGAIGWVAFAVLDASAGVERLAGTYLAIRIWSAPAVLITYVQLGGLLGQHQGRGVLAQQVTVNGLNIGLDLWFVLGLGWGVAGVAAATVIAEWSGVAIGAWLLAGALKKRPGVWRLDALRDRAAFRNLLAINSDIFIRTLCLTTAFAWLTAQGAKLGDAVLAANAVLLNFLTFASYGLDGFAHTAEALIGTAFGQGRRASFDQAVRRSTLWAGLVAAAISLVYALAGGAIIDLLTGLEEVRLLARQSLGWLVAAPLLAVWGYQLDGIFLGATATREMRNMMIVALLGYLVLSWALMPVFGNNGLWAAMMGFMVLRAVTLGAMLPRLYRRVSPA